MTAPPLAADTDIGLVIDQQGPRFDLNSAAQLRSAGSDQLALRRRRAAPAGVRRVPTPTVAPPFDDERAEYEDRPQERSAVSRANGSLALALPLPFAAPSAAVPRLRLAPSAESIAGPALAPPAVWSARFVRVLLEALAGLRPVSQIGAWADAEVCRALARRLGAAERCRDLPRDCGQLRSLHVSTPAGGVAEVCAVVGLGHRIRAVALRIEAAEGQWRCTKLLIG